MLHKYTHVKPAVLPYLHVTAAAVLNRSVELDWNWPTMFTMDLLHLFIGVPGYFLGARPASLAHKISYWRTDIPTFGPLGAQGAHRFAFRWALMQILHSLKCNVFVMMARMLIQRADLFPRSHDHFVRNATRLPRRSEFPCYVGDIQPLTAYPPIPQYRSVTQPQRRLAGIFACHLLLELRASHWPICCTWRAHFIRFRLSTSFVDFEFRWLDNRLIWCFALYN